MKSTADGGNVVNADAISDLKVITSRHALKLVRHNL
ncbi:MAG: hypothetical protein ACI8SJ_001987 [Shewanella sp.]|jgi:hypothetical protein